MIQFQVAGTMVVGNPNFRLFQCSVSEYYVTFTKERPTRRRYQREGVLTHTFQDE